jgi:acetyltransferase-like isoleucine patch superfamily enzyme
MERKPIDKIAMLFEANPSGIALQLLVGRLWNGISSKMMAFMLKAPGLRLGPGCRVVGGRHISFGRNIHAGRNLWLEAVTSYRSQRFQPTIVIGDYVCFSNDVHISSVEAITIGTHVLFGSKIFIADHNHGIYKGEQQSNPEEAPSHRILGGGGRVVIEENAWIGDNSVILGPASIGRSAIIGANSVVRGIVPSNSIVAGVPARVIKMFNPQRGSWDQP